MSYYLGQQQGGICMWKLSPKYKWPLLILFNTLPFALLVLLYPCGIWSHIFLFLPFLVGLTFLNYQNSNKTLHFIIIQMYILICLIGSGYVSTYLYYHNVSNDSMTPIAGQVVVVLETATNIVTTAIAAVLKTKTIQKQT